MATSTQDAPGQCARVDAVIRAATATGERLLISPVVLCEMVWVLESCYGYGRADVSNALAHVLKTVEFEAFVLPGKMIEGLAAG